MFDEESINWLHGIKCLKQSGMPIEIIKVHRSLSPGDSTIPQRAALMMEHKKVALAKLEEAKQHVAHLEEKPPYIKPFWSTALQTRRTLAIGTKFSICIVTYFTRLLFGRRERST